MARRRGRRGRRGGFKIPIITLAILAGQAAWANAAGGAGILDKLDQFSSLYTGFHIQSRTFDPSRLLIGYGPWLAKRFIMPIARVRMPVRGLPISIS